MENANARYVDHYFVRFQPNKKAKQTTLSPLLLVVCRGKTLRPVQALHLQPEHAQELAARLSDVLLQRPRRQVPLERPLLRENGRRLRDRERDVGDQRPLPQPAHLTRLGWQRP